MGTPDFAVGTLKAIIDAGHEILCVVTQPDKPKGRGKELSMPPVKELALEYELTVYQPVKVRNEEFVGLLRDMKPDVIVVVAFGQILPKSILEIPKYGCVNVHASLLPKYRGAAPIQWAVIDGEKESGVTTMLMDEGLDTGDILLTSRRKLSPKETGGSLFEKLSEDGAKLLTETLDGLFKGTITPVPQALTGSTYARMLDKSTGLIDFDNDAAKIECLIRGLNPWPSAYTFYNGRIMKVWDSEVIDEKFDGAAPGEIVRIDRDGFVVKCKANALKVLELQLEGKKRMDAKSFLLGCKIEVGEKLCSSR